MTGEADQADRISFSTDDALARRLQQVENGLRHLEAMIPSMAREVAAIRAEARAAAYSYGIALAASRNHSDARRNLQHWLPMQPSLKSNSV